MTARGGQAAARTSRHGRRALQIIPAVDVLDEGVVRLEQGRFDRVALRAGQPDELVARLASERPPLIHVVDLTGARTGKLRPELFRRLVGAADGVPVQASGGIRSRADAEELLDAGAARVVVGTAAFATEDALAAFTTLGDRVVVAIDVRGGEVAAAGWERGTGLEPEGAVCRCAQAGIHRVLCTAIERDGMLQGPDLDLLGRVRDAADVRLIAAGGVRSVDDLAAVDRLGIEGVVTGRALLEGRIPLAVLRGLG